MSMKGTGPVESKIRSEVLGVIKGQLAGVAERSVTARIHKEMTSKGEKDPRKIHLYIVSRWLKKNDVNTFFTSEELIKCISADTKLNKGAVKRLIEKTPFDIPPQLKPTKKKKEKKKNKPAMAFTSKVEGGPYDGSSVDKKIPYDDPETFIVTTPPREAPYTKQQQQTAILRKKVTEKEQALVMAEPTAVKLTALARKILDNYSEQIGFIVNQLKGETLESIALKIANSLKGQKLPDGKPEDTPLFQTARWFLNNRDDLPITKALLLKKIVEDTGITLKRVRKLLDNYDFNLPESILDPTKFIEEKLQKPELKSSPVLKVVETPKPEKKVEVIEKITLNPAIEKKYVISGPGIEILIKTGGNKIAVAPKNENGIGVKPEVGKDTDTIPEGFYTVDIDGYTYKRCDKGIKASYCYACKKPFNGIWLCVATLYDEYNTFKAVPCHPACIHGKYLFIKNRQHR